MQLRPEELTGVLTSLLDAQFFEQVFISDGAVAWPGEIELAPDAMYTQVASHGHIHVEVQQAEEVKVGAPFSSQLPRLYELRGRLTDPCHPEAYFRDFEDRLQDRSCFATFALWEKELQSLDPLAWEHLKSKAADYLKRDVKGREWQQLFDVLAEASAYRYLRDCEKCSAVRFIPKSNDQTPDLEGVRDHDRVLCELKTINISDVEVGVRRAPPTARKVSDQLADGFFRKLDSDIAKAKSQLQSYDPNGDAQHVVYFKICFDDWAVLTKTIIFGRLIGICWSIHQKSRLS